MGFNPSVSSGGSTSGKVVKSKQIVFATGNPDGRARTVAISNVDASKTMINISSDAIIRGETSSSSDIQMYTSFPRITKVENDSFTFEGGRSFYISSYFGNIATFEIIEFY